MILLLSTTGAHRWSARAHAVRAAERGRRAPRRPPAAPRCRRCSTPAAPLRLPRDLADEEPWQLSLGRSRARRRAAELRFVPARLARQAHLAGRARRADGRPHGEPRQRPGDARRRRPSPEPATTTEHMIVLSYGSEGRQVQLLQQALGGDQSRRRLRAGNRSRGAQLPGEQRPDRRRRRRAADERRAAQPERRQARSSPTSAASSPGTRRR